jgi:hypothetical protein
MGERFHRYMNKVQQINAADTQSFGQWVMAAYFLMYAWNASPINGTDIVRSYAAKAHIFLFRSEVIEREWPNIPTGEGQAAMDHVDMEFNLRHRQIELLDILNEERTQGHRDLKNANKTRRTFEPGGLVIKRRQTQSNTAEGVVSTYLFKGRGPYKVIRAVDKNAYIIQKIHAVSGRRRLEKMRKEAAMRLEKDPRQ